MTGAVPVLPLACFPYPVPHDVVATIRAAKEQLCAESGLEFKLQICEAVPGSPTRVLAFAPPSFACDSAKVRNPRSVPEVKRWLEWVLDPEADVAEGFTTGDWIGWVIPGATEVTDGMELWQIEQKILREKEERETREVAFR